MAPRKLLYAPRGESCDEKRMQSAGLGWGREQGNHRLFRTMPFEQGGAAAILERYGHYLEKVLAAPPCGARARSQSQASERKGNSLCWQATGQAPKQTDANRDELGAQARKRREDYR